MIALVGLWATSERSPLEMTGISRLFGAEDKGVDGAEPVPPAISGQVDDSRLLPAVELVEPDADIVTPRLLTVEQPFSIPSEVEVAKDGKISVAVLVNEQGEVVEAKLDEGSLAEVEIDTAALLAAQSARFEPPLKDGIPTKAWLRITFPVAD